MCNYDIINNAEVKEMTEKEKIHSGDIYYPSGDEIMNEQLKQKFLELRTAFENNRITEDELINPVYAIVCETAKRVLQKDPYKVQVMGAICLNSGDVAAMATGEGKTLASSMPAVLNAITQQSVHIATANEYLAKRDYEEMGRIYNFLGLSVGVVYSGQSIIEKQQASTNTNIKGNMHSVYLMSSVATTEMAKDIIIEIERVKNNAFDDGSFIYSKKDVIFTCEIEHCLTCSLDALTCEECQPAFTLNGNECVSSN